MIVTDESNSFSDKGRAKRKYLTVVCTRTKDAKGFSDAVRFIPSDGGRVKYYNSTQKTKDEVIGDVAKNDMTVVEYHKYIDYASVGNPEKKKVFYMEVLEKALLRALDLNSSEEVDVLIDNPPVNADDSIRTMVSELIARGYHIRWFAIGISATSDLLGVQDYITGTMSDEIEEMKPTQYEKLVLKVRK